MMALSGCLALGQGGSVPEGQDAGAPALLGEGTSASFFVKWVHRAMQGFVGLIHWNKMRAQFENWEMPWTEAVVVPLTGTKNGQFEIPD